jgi:hypothetical protein
LNCFHIFIISGYIDMSIQRFPKVALRQLMGSRN